MNPAFIKDMPIEYYHGNASYFGGFSGFYNHYYNTHPKMEKRFNIPTVKADPTISMTTQVGMDIKEEIEQPAYKKTSFNLLQGLEYRNFDPVDALATTEREELARTKI